MNRGTTDGVGLGAIPVGELLLSDLLPRFAQARENFRSDRTLRGTFGPPGWAGGNERLPSLLDELRSASSKGERRYVAGDPDVYFSLPLGTSETPSPELWDFRARLAEVLGEATAERERAALPPSAELYLLIHVVETMRELIPKRWLSLQGFSLRESELLLQAIRERGEAQDELDQRNTAMLQMRRSGASLDQIGKAMGISRQRVQQVLSRMDAPTVEEIRESRAAVSAREIEQARARIADDLIGHPNSSLTEVALRTGLAESDVQEALTPALRSMMARHVGGPKTRWTREDALASLVAAAVILDAGTEDRPLTGPLYDSVRDDVQGPSRVKISHIFGAWSSALNEAGLIGLKVDRKSGSAFSDDDLLDSVVEYLLAPESGSRSFRGYEGWRHQHNPAAPSGSLIRARLGPWEPTRAKAWERAISMGRVATSDILSARSFAMGDLSDDDAWMVEEVFRQMEDAGANPTSPDTYDRFVFEGAPSAATLVSTFGSWGLVLASMGWDPTSLARTSHRVPHERMLSVLGGFARGFEVEFGRLPSATDWQRERDKRVTVGPWAYERAFGSWAEAVAESLQEGAERVWD